MSQYVAGVDEAGRGPLAGPVVAAAVILNPQEPIAGLADSKQLSEKRRDCLAQQIKDKALAFAIASASVAEIDDINILHASLLAMQRAVHALSIMPTLALIDGNRCPVLNCPSQALIKGDQREPAIMAASILAKVSRDAHMKMLHEQCPQYDFARHKGYPTKAHVAALEKFGASDFHRRSFAPVRRVMTTVFL